MCHLEEYRRLPATIITLRLCPSAIFWEERHCGKYLYVDGVGKLAVDAITMRDYPIIQAYVAWMAVIYVLVNLVTDIIYHYLDPRVRLGGDRA